MLSDDKLVEQILLGNENAAEELIKRYYTSILRYCRWPVSYTHLDVYKRQVKALPTAALLQEKKQQAMVCCT